MVINGESQKQILGEKQETTHAALQAWMVMCKEVDHSKLL